jgi:hypothetical protein
MTFRQAFVKAMLELGFTQKEIDVRMAQGDMVVLTAAGNLGPIDKELPLKPGVTEEQVVQGAKQIMLKWLNMPDDVAKDALEKGLERVRKKNKPQSN